MAIPTSGTYNGLYIYQEQPIPSSLDTLIGEVEALTGLTGQNLILLGAATATNATVTFGSGSLNYSGTGPGGAPASGTIATGTIGGQNDTTFEADQGNGTTYLVSNNAVEGAAAIQLDTLLTNLSTEFPAAALTIAALKAAADGLGLGSDYVLSSAVFSGGSYTPPCFARGTMIATPAGERAVETLGTGDLVLLADGGTAVVRWVGHRRMRLTTAGLAASTLPVRIRTGALGGGLPKRDLVVSPDHALFVDGVLVPAGLLVDGHGIRQEQVAEIEYFHVELPAHALLLAEGAAAESYRDTGNRSRFANAALVELRPADMGDPGAATGPLCAELVLGGERLARARASLPAVAPVRMAS